MSLYCHITGGVVDYGPGALPKSWEKTKPTVSNLSKATPALLKALDWLPVTEVAVVKGSDQTDDGQAIVVEADAVIVTPKYRDMTAAEIADRTASHLVNLRAERDNRLAETNWMFFTDSPPLNAATQAEWATYRQELRNLPATVADPANPVWPEKP